MRRYVKLAITSLFAIASLAALVGSASARNLSISNQNVRVTWTSLEFEGGAVVRCPVTLEGSFHTRTITKTIGSLIGYITRAISKNESCTGGTGWAFNGTERQGETTLANTLPWHLTYEGFAGTLPNITRIRLLLRNARFLIEAIGVRCIYTTGTRGNATGTATRGAGGTVDNLVASGEITPDAGSNFLCANPGSFTSRPEDGRITLLNASTRIVVTLI